MLLNSFYKILKRESGAGSVNAVISFDKEHPIFRGHFPGHPVVPGVCMIQTLRELMELETDKKLRIATGDNLKFLAIINPEEHHSVDVGINYSVNGDIYTINASLSAPQSVFFKFKGTFTIL